MPAGPLADTAAHDINYVARAGVLSLLPADKLHAPPVQSADYLGAAIAAFALTSGVLQSRATGRGTRLETSLYDAAVFGVGLLHAQAMLGIEHRPAEHFLVGGLAAYSIYECADGRFVSVGALEPKFWNNLCRLIGLDDEIAGDHWEPARQEPLRARLRAVFVTRSQAEWAELLESEDVCVQPLASIGEATLDKHQVARGRFEQVRHPVTGELLDLPASPVIIEGRRRSEARLPGVGADTRQLLARAGFTEAHIDELVASSVALAPPFSKTQVDDRDRSTESGLPAQ